MKKTLTLFFLAFLTVASYSQTNISGFISANTTWNIAGSPYIITGNALLSSGYTLTIDPGVVIKFDTGRTLQIDGELIAIGTAANRITFTSLQTSPAAGDWSELHFSDLAVNATFGISGNYLSGCILKYCDVLYGGKGLYGQIHIESSSPYISQCNISHSQSSGVYSNGLSCTVDSSKVNDCAGYGLAFSIITANPCGLSVRNDSIENCKYAGVYISGDPVCGVTIQNDYFYGSARYGAVQAGDLANVSEQILITDNNFINDTLIGGGNMGIVTASGHHQLIARNNFINNLTSSAILFCTSITGVAVCTVEENTFFNNATTVGQSAVLAVQSYNKTIRRNNFINNKVDGSAIASFTLGSNDTIQCNVFQNNQSGTSSNGVIYVQESGKMLLEKNIFDGNYSSGGINSIAVGTFYVFSSQDKFYFINNTIKNNSAPMGTCLKFYPTFTNKELLIVHNNDFTNNSCNSVLYFYSTNVANVNLDFLYMKHNNFSNPNSTYELYNDIPYGSPNVYCDSNYWGSASTQHIDSVIYDYFDNGNKSVVYYQPVLTSAVVIDTTCPGSFPNSVFEIGEKDINDYLNSFPNPFSSYTTISLPVDMKDASLLLYNVFGQKVKEIAAINGKHITLSRENLPAGIYIYQVVEKDKRVGNGKIVVE